MVDKILLILVPVEAAAYGGDAPAVADAGSSVELGACLRGNPVVVVEGDVDGGCGEHDSEKGDAPSGVDVGLGPCGCGRRGERGR